MQKYVVIALFVILLLLLCCACAADLDVDQTSLTQPSFYVESSRGEEPESDINTAGFEQNSGTQRLYEIWNNIIMIALGFVFGFISSLLSWMFIIKGISPKIEISDKILLIPSVYKNGNTLPKIKIENKSRYDAFEVDLRGRIFLFGMIEDHPDIPTLFIVNVGGNAPHPYLPGRKKGLKEKTSGRTFHLHMNKATRKEMAQHIFHFESGEEPTLADCLTLDKRNYLEVCVFSSHGFSFSRGILKHRYVADDIIEGYFDDHGITVRKSPDTEYPHQEIELEAEDIQDLGI